MARRQKQSLAKANSRQQGLDIIRKNSYDAQQLALMRQAGGYAAFVTPLQVAAKKGKPTVATPTPTPTPVAPPPSNLPPPVAPPPTIAAPSIAPIEDQATKKQRYKGRKTVPLAEPGQPVPQPIGKPPPPPGAGKVPGASNKLAKATAAYQSRTDVQKRIQDRQQRQDRLQTLGIGQNLASGIQALPQNAASRLESAPTPLGLALPLLLLLLLYLLLIPVNGKSRLEWLWLTIIKQAYVTQAEPIVTATGSGGYSPPIATNPQFGGLVVNTPDGSYIYSGDDF